MNAVIVADVVSCPGAERGFYDDNYKRGFRASCPSCKEVRMFEQMGFAISKNIKKQCEHGMRFYRF